MPPAKGGGMEINMDILNEYAYHYYERAFPKFANIRSFPPEEAICLDHKFIRDKEDKIRYYNARTAVEEMMINKFRSKGGIPVIPYPHYFVIHKFDFLSSVYNQARCVKIPISCFDRNTISFTYGDSFDVFYTSRHPTKRKLYTVDEIGGIIDEYKGTRTNYNLYIEMQLWDNPYKYVDHMTDEKINNYQYKLKGVFEEIQIEEYEKYKSFIKNEHYTLPAGIHGINHVKRVLLHCIILAKLNKLNEEQKNVLYLSAVYHDIGRTADGVDKMHGLKSCQKINQLALLDGIPENQRDIVKYIIMYHCLDCVREMSENRNFSEKNICWTYLRMRMHWIVFVLMIWMRSILETIIQNS